MPTTKPIPKPGDTIRQTTYRGKRWERTYNYRVLCYGQIMGRLDSKWAHPALILVAHCRDCHAPFVFLSELTPRRFLRRVCWDCRPGNALAPTYGRKVAP